MLGVSAAGSYRNGEAAVQARPGFARASSVVWRRSPLPTGIRALDSLIGGLTGGAVHLFSGDPECIGWLVHRLLVVGSARGAVLYMNNTDYYKHRSELVPERLATDAKAFGIGFSTVLERVVSAAAYSKERQAAALGALERSLEERGGAALVVVHDISAFRGAGEEGSAEMDLVASRLWRIASERGIPVVVTSRDLRLCSGLIASVAKVVVECRRQGKGICATLVRHPERETPASVSVQDHCIGGGDQLGRITPPFRQSYQELLASLRGGYLGLIRSPGGKEAFEALVREAWDREFAAMAASGIPMALDAMNLTANVSNRGEIEALKRSFSGLVARIAELESRVAALERPG